MAVEALLDHVRGAGQGLGAEDAVGDVHGCLVQQAAFVRHGLVAVGCQTGGGILGAHAPVGGEDLADLLAGGQNLDIGLGALSRGQAPVVDCADGAGAVDVLEIQAVLLDDLALHGADGGAVGVLVALYALGCFHCHSVFSFSFESSGPCHRAADAIPIIIGRRAEQLENFLDISALSLYSFLCAVGIQACFVECAVLVYYIHVQNDERCFLKLLISPKESKIVLFYLKILLTEI